MTNQEIIIQMLQEMRNNQEIMIDNQLNTIEILKTLKAINSNLETIAGIEKTKHQDNILNEKSAHLKPQDPFKSIDEELKELEDDEILNF